MTIDGGAYVHVPFCRRKCAYCDFYSLSRDLVHDYVPALLSHIRDGGTGHTFRTVYLGGGTPSLLSPAEICAVLSALRDAGGQAKEVTVEVNPESVTRDFLLAARDAGANRVSMGVQSFDDNELRALGRLADRKTCLAAYELIRSCGFDNVSLDLMLAVPGQTDASLDQSLQTALSLAPDHLSAYLLKVEPNTPFGKAGVKEADEETQRRFYLHTSDVLRDAGYEHYEISNFARPGRRSAHNMGYWQGKPYAAYGPGAHGFDGAVRYAYEPDADAFIRAHGHVPRVCEETLTDEDRRTERLMLGLRTADGISSKDVPVSARALMERLVNEHLCVKTKEGYALTPAGFLVSDAVIVDLLA